MAATDRPFKCSVCRRGFRSHSSLVKHSEEHVAPRRCPNCGKQNASEKMRFCSRCGFSLTGVLSARRKRGPNT